MATDSATSRLSDLLIAPQETLNVELKNWLNLESNDDKATLAKALLALANHGGGFVLIGFTETDMSATVADGQPATLDCYSQDLVNGIVQGYADPAFHCSVHFVSSPAGVVHPIIVVPGNHRVPIRAKRSGPNNQTVQQNAIYVRRPGPKSETPQNGQDWDELLARCLSARRDELIDRVRDLLSGAVGFATGKTSDDAQLDAWIKDCVGRWHQMIEELPSDDPARCPHGFHWFAYHLRGNLKKLSPQDFLDIVQQSEVSHSGWPPFWVPTRQGIEPYMNDGSIECWFGREGARDSAHADFWRLSPDGFAFLLRGFQEDTPDVVTPHNLSPGTVFDLVLPVWRNGEVLLQAERLAVNMSTDAHPAIILAFRVHYTGLKDRKLVSVSNRRHLWDDRFSHQNEITLSTLVDTSQISPNLPEVLHPMLEPLYALFNFMRLPTKLVQEEVNKLRS